MNHDHHRTLLNTYAAVLGDAAVTSLDRRGLIRTIDRSSSDPIDTATVDDRTVATVAGLALGDAFASRFRRSRNDDGMDLAGVHRWLDTRRRGQGGHRLSAPTQTFVMSAEVMLDDPFDAPRDLASSLSRRSRSLRSPGNAIRHTVANLRAGHPWFEAAPPSRGDAALPRAVAVGLALHARPDRVAVAASFDAAVSHASPEATGSAACSPG